METPKPELPEEVKTQIAEAVVNVLNQTTTMSNAPTAGDGDNKRGKISVILLGVGAGLTAITLTYVPQLVPVAFGISFIGLVMLLVWLNDKYFFPEQNTFQKVADDAIATAIVFAAIVFACVKGIEMGAVLFAVPAVDTAEQGATVRALENSLQHYSPPLAPDTTTGGQSGEPQGK